MVAATFSMLVRNSGDGKGTTRNVISASHTSLPSILISAFVTGVAGALVHHFSAERERLTGSHERSQLCFLERREERHAGELGRRR